LAARTLVLVLFLPLAAIGCGGGSGQALEATSIPSRTLKVVSTVSPITSIVENIGGTRIQLEGVVPEGANSHTFEPAPSVSKLLAEADLIVLNGLFLEEPTLKMAEANRKQGAPILLLGEGAIAREEWQFDFSFPEAKGRPNPHLWPDPWLALSYAGQVRDQLASLDPSNAAYYGANYTAFEARVQQLDRAIRAAVQSVPPQNRRLLTYHDSWAYFARRYGMEVIGAVQPSGSSQPSAREVARLIDQLRELNLPAVFGSEVFPSDVMEQIAREGGARFIDQLRDDDLPGEPGDPEHTYLGLMRQNMEIMIPALGGDLSALKGFDSGPVFQGASGAKYPQ
jgi:manganese/iron transport system substrate-binding protein